MRGQTKRILPASLIAITAARTRRCRCPCPCRCRRCCSACAFCSFFPSSGPSFCCWISCRFSLQQQQQQHGLGRPEGVSSRSIIAHARYTLGPSGRGFLGDLTPPYPSCSRAGGHRICGSRQVAAKVTLPHVNHWLVENLNRTIHDQLSIPYILCKHNLTLSIINGSIDSGMYHKHAGHVNLN